jgi:hypothetical protein
MSRPYALLLVLCASLPLTGCVERKLFIRSDPPGATVYLNHEPALAQKTPAETEFTDYGTYAVRLVQEDCEELEVLAEVEAPWWVYPPFDLVTELLLPVTLKDHHEFTYKLTPLSEALSNEVLRERHREMIRRAEEFREESKGELEEEGR